MILVSHHCFSVSLWCPHWPGSHLLNANQHHCSLGRPLCHCEVLQDHTRRVGWVIWIVLKSVFISLRHLTPVHTNTNIRHENMPDFHMRRVCSKWCIKMADGRKENDNRIKKIFRKALIPWLLRDAKCNASDICLSRRKEVKQCLHVF